MPTPSPNPLGLLVDRIADGDREAFRRLCAFLALPVWRAAVGTTHSPDLALSATRGTLLEMWHLARYHGGTDIRVWAAEILARRLEDRRRLDLVDPAVCAEYDIRVQLELVDLLGRRAALVRVGYPAFVRVDQIADAPVVVAAMWPAAVPA